MTERCLTVRSSTMGVFMSHRLAGMLILIAILFLIVSSCDLSTKTPDQVAVPSFDPPGGAYESPQTVSITSITPEASIFYSVDGSDPTLVYTGPFVLEQGDYTLKAKATRPGWKDSPLASAYFNFESLPQPVINIPGGLYSSAQHVCITCSFSDAIIRYTTDGSEPTEESAQYNAAIPVDSTTIIKARAFMSGWNPSPIAEERYVFNTFILVEGGTFFNGVSNVTLSSFYINKYEITQAEFQAVMETDLSSFTESPTRPVDTVSWFRAIEYCNLRSMQEGLTPCYSYGAYDLYGTNPAFWPDDWDTNYHETNNVNCNWNAEGYRLPTEMEWMYAAMGGNQSQGYRFSGSNNVYDVAWWRPNSGDRTHDVGELAPNELGLYDMSGNVYEHCWDLYNPSYPNLDQTNPHGWDWGYHRICRGGSWSYATQPGGVNLCDVAVRNKTIPHHCNWDDGFRCVRNYP